jgi:Uma2 family endonuclease
MRRVSEPARKFDRVYTYADYAQWPDDERWELIQGTAWNMSPAPSTRHQATLSVLGRFFLPWAASGSCAVFVAPFDVVLPEWPGQARDEATNVVQPDLSVICDRSRLREWGCYGAPDLVVEILSPHTSKKDLNEKFALYEKHRVAEYWVVDPGNLWVHIYRLGADSRFGDPRILAVGGTSREPGATTAESAVCGGLAVPLAELFAEP